MLDYVLRRALDKDASRVPRGHQEKTRGYFQRDLECTDLADDSGLDGKIYEATWRMHPKTKYLVRGDLTGTIPDDAP